MAITIKEIQVKATIERNPVNPVLSKETIQKIKQEMMAELKVTGTQQNKNRKER